MSNPNRPISLAYFRQIFWGYLGAALWSSTDENGEPLDDGRDRSDITPETRRAMLSECIDFYRLCRDQGIDWRGQLQPSSFGHDFWLTRCGHGAGFWDRGLGQLGEELTKWAKTYGGVDLYVGDDGKIYA